MLKNYLQQLDKDLQIYRDSIKETAEEIVSSGFSKFPIFIATVFEEEIGELILDAKELDTTFSIQVTTAEQMNEKGIIPDDKIEFFKSSFKSPEDFICLLLLTTEAQQFIFYPYLAAKKA